MPAPARPCTPLPALALPSSSPCQHRRHCLCAAARRPTGTMTRTVPDVGKSSLCLRPCVILCHSVCPDRTPALTPPPSPFSPGTLPSSAPSFSICISIPLSSSFFSFRSFPPLPHFPPSLPNHYFLFYFPFLFLPFSFPFPPFLISSVLFPISSLSYFFPSLSPFPPFPLSPILFPVSSIPYPSQSLSRFLSSSRVTIDSGKGGRKKEGEGVEGGRGMEEGVQEEEEDGGGGSECRRPEPHKRNVNEPLRVDLGSSTPGILERHK